VVIAGRSDCPYLARVELLGDQLKKNLPAFQLHKIVKTPEEWPSYLQEMCGQRGWSHQSSPMVWRELIDRGGKGVLIGGASDFQEYVKGYYGLESDLTSTDMRKIGGENFKTKQEVDVEEQDIKAQSKPLHVCVTGAQSPTCYSLLSALTSGEVFGPTTEIHLMLYDQTHDDAAKIAGLRMEVEDLCQGLLRVIEVVESPAKAFAECSVIVVLDDLLQEEEEEYDAYIKRNCDFFSNYATVINQVAKKNVRVLVAGRGPINFNTMMMIKNAPTIPRQNFVALSRGLENQAKAVIGERLSVNTAGVVDLVVWGNVNGQHYIDTTKSKVHGFDGAVWGGPPSYSVSVEEMVHDQKWLEKEYLELVNGRTVAVETGLGHSCAASSARSLITMLTHWWSGSPLGQVFSLAVCSDGWYGVPEGFVFSYPVTMSPSGYWTVVQDMNLTEDMKVKLLETVDDLRKEYEVIYPPPKPPTPPAPPTPEEVVEEPAATESTDQPPTTETSGEAGEAGEGVPTDETEADPDAEKPGSDTEVAANADPTGEEEATPTDTEDAAPAGEESKGENPATSDNPATSAEQS